MIPRRSFYVLIAVLTFTIGLLCVRLAADDSEQIHRELPVADEPVKVAEKASDPEPFNLPEDNCGDDLSDDIPLRPIIRKWIRKEKIKDTIYCSKTAIEASGYNGTNVLPQLIDINDDGIDELAVRYGCSGTGNCSMKIFQRFGKSYRQVFADQQSVNYFEKVGERHDGFRDIQTRSHGSCCDGDQVTYRFTGKAYKPISCASYSYWDENVRGNIIDVPRIKKQKCSEVLDRQ
ncbi:MAG TPA: hypothetical protein PKA82_00470 [Pyrinomonadaceae bacterium]|nr:hypothetical protein [Pyrinomonadaceae bacterium]